MSETYIAIMMLSLVLCGIAYCYLTSEGYRLKKLVKQANEGFGDAAHAPGLKLRERVDQIHYEKDAMTVQEWIQNQLRQDKIPEDRILFAVETHKKLVNFGVREIEINLGTDSGCWSYVLYVYEYHTVVFFVNID